MKTFLETAKFSRVYLGRYWFRFVLGLILAFASGVSNGLFLPSVYTMLNRLADPVHVMQITEKGLQDKAAEQKTEAQENSVSRALKLETQILKQKFYVLIDPWLPIQGQPLDWKRILGCLLFLPLMAALRGFLGYGGSYLLAWSGQRITSDVKLDAFKKISTLSLDYFNKKTTMEIVNRIESDATGLNNFLKLGLSDLIKEPATIVSVFFWMLIIDWKFTLIALAFLPFCIIPTRKISNRIKQMGRMDFTNFTGQSNITMESFQNIRITKAYGLEPEQARAFDKAGKKANHYAMKGVQGREMLNPIVQTFCAIGISVVLLYANWTNSKWDTISTFLVALMLFYAPFKRLNTMGVYITQLNLSLERLMELFKLEPTVKEDLNPLPLPNFKSSIEFKDVAFSYGDGPVLQHISFKLPRGKRLGLAGESGSGKSSLLNLLFRFYDVTEGVIQIDGEPIQRYRLADLRAQLALVSQDILLFNATVEENIRYGKIGATRAEIENAARRAHAGHFIAELPEGYDTPLGERGIRLSGGQRQRISIARAFVRNSPILVLDEATASLDSKSEAEVQDAIDELAENRTVICVAHRLSTLRAMHEILVMERGVIVEQGSFDELLGRRGPFAAMAARQSIFPKAA
jgi:ABC-type multidrug transport system fused ATPase/permease subunit